MTNNKLGFLFTFSLFLLATNALATKVIINNYAPYSIIASFIKDNNHKHEKIIRGSSSVIIDVKPSTAVKIFQYNKQCKIFLDSYTIYSCTTINFYPQTFGIERSNCTIGY